MSNSTLVRAKIGFPSADVRTDIIGTQTSEIVVIKLPYCLLHFQKQHINCMQTKPSIEHCFSVTFVQKSSPESLDISESQWISRHDAQINTNKTLLLKIK